MEEARISSRQFYFIIFTVIVSVSLFYVPLAFRLIRQEIWIAFLIAGFIDVFVVAVMLYILGQRHPGETMFRYSETILGSAAGKAVAIIFVLFFLSSAAISLRIFANALATLVFPNTPLVVLVAAMLLVSTYAVLSGLEVIARLSELLGVVMMASALLLLLLTAKDVNPSRLAPLVEHGFGDILRASLIPTSWFGICIIMGILFPHHNQPRDSLRAKGAAVWTGTFIMAAISLFSVAIHGRRVSGLTFPFYMLARMISIGQFIERVEVLWLTAWIAGGFVTVSTLFYISCLGLAQVFRLKTYAVFGWPVSSALLGLSLYLFGSVVQEDLFVMKVFPYYALPIEAGLVTVLLVGSLIRGPTPPGDDRY